MPTGAPTPALLDGLSLPTLIGISAAIGAVVAATIGGLFTLINAALDRRARYKDLLFSSAIELAKFRVTTGIEVAKHWKKAAEFVDATTLTESYYRMLSKLHRDGKLPDEAYWNMTEGEKAALKGDLSWADVKADQKPKQ